MESHHNHSGRELGLREVGKSSKQSKEVGERGRSVRKLNSKPE